MHKANTACTPFPFLQLSPRDMLFKAEQELENVKGWNQVFSYQGKLEVDITDSEIQQWKTLQFRRQQLLSRKQ